MNNENQNLNNMNNNGIETNIGNPTPIPNMGMPVNPEPLPTNGVPVVNPTPINGVIDNLEQPVVSNQMNEAVTVQKNTGNLLNEVPTSVVTPSQEIAQPISPVTEGIMQAPPKTPNLNNGSMMNLQPEGTVLPTPEVSAPSTVAPLTGTPLTEQTIMNPTPAETSMNTNMMGMPNQGINPMGGIPPQNPNMGLMGGVPMPPTPPTNEEKPKKKMNKTLLLVLIIVLICAVGFGVWYFLSASKEKAPSASITPKLAQFELGKNINLEDASEFVTLSGTTASNCKVQTDIDPNKAGSYTYSVTCNNGTLKSENNKVVVSDTTPPEVTLKEIAVAIGTDVIPEDLIDTISDASECSAQFKETVNTAEEGEIDVTIVVSDAYGNETEIIGTLTISSDAPQYYLYCESTHESEDFSNAIIEKAYKYGINSVGSMYNAIEEISYTFETKEEFEEAMEKADDKKFDGIEGKVKIEKDILRIKIERTLESSDLEEIYDVSPFPDTETGITDVHQGAGESCFIDN